jgi:hypothetical protein
MAAMVAMVNLDLTVPTEAAVEQVDILVTAARVVVAHTLAIQFIIPLLEVVVAAAVAKALSVTFFQVCLVAV